jgi:hypothetical protein
MIEGATPAAHSIGEATLPTELSETLMRLAVTRCLCAQHRS